MVMAAQLCFFSLSGTRSCLSVILPQQSLIHLTKWMVKGSSIVLRCGRASWLCLPSPEPVWLPEWSCAAGDILHDPFKALGVVYPCPWVWHPQWCFCWPHFCRLQSPHEVSALLALNSPAYINLSSYFKELKWCCMWLFKSFQYNMRSNVNVQPCSKSIKLEGTRLNIYLITVGLSLQVQSGWLVTGGELSISQVHGGPLTQAAEVNKMQWWLSLVGTSWWQFPLAWYLPHPQPRYLYTSCSLSRSNATTNPSWSW